MGCICSSSACGKSSTVGSLVGFGVGSFVGSLPRGSTPINNVGFSVTFDVVLTTGPSEGCVLGLGVTILVGSSLGLDVGSTLGSYVGNPVCGGCDGLNVGRLVGLSVGAAVVGLEVGLSVGFIVGFSVGFIEGNPVGLVEGSSVITGTEHTCPAQRRSSQHSISKVHD